MPKSKLTNKVRASGKGAQGEFMGPERHHDGLAYGIEIDGAVYQLDSQPPLAVSHGWGNMSWLYQRIR